MTIRVRISVEDGRRVVALQGFLSGPLDEAATKAFAALEEASGPVVLDLREVVIGSPAALAEIVEVLNRYGDGDVPVVCDRLSARRLLRLCSRLTTDRRAPPAPARPPPPPAAHPPPPTRTDPPRLVRTMRSRVG